MNAKKLAIVSIAAGTTMILKNWNKVYGNNTQSSVKAPAFQTAYTKTESLAPVDFEKVFPEMTSVGSGVIDFKRIFAESDKAGIKHYFVENDYPKSEFDNIQASYKYLHDLRY